MPELGLINYTLIRSKRKTLSLQINTNAELIIRCPQRLPVKKVESFILDKSNWIEKKQHAIQSKQMRTPNYLDGEYFLYLGSSYPLTHDKSLNKKIHFDGESFKINGQGYSAFHQWYKSAFKKIALPRLKYYADLYQLNYQQVRLKAQKTLWGSCSSRNNINLNYLLIQAPMNVIDYVIVHELAHTRIKNHSKDFWQLVESILPEYRASKHWLKDNGHKLHNL